MLAVKQAKMRKYNHSNDETLKTLVGSAQLLNSKLTLSPMTPYCKK